MEDFDKIYAEYYSEVYKFVLTLCQNHTLAEEITQESFFKALKSIDSFNGNSKISTWLCKIARNTLFSYTKKHNRQVDYPLDIILSDENIEEQFADKETAYAIHKVLQVRVWLFTTGDSVQQGFDRHQLSGIHCCLEKRSVRSGQKAY